MSDYQAVGRSASAAELQVNLVRCAEAMDFGLISAVLMKGEYESSNVVTRVVSNTPAAFVDIATNLDQARADPVLHQLMRTCMPIVYDQKLYVEAGAGDMWEMQAPYGYCTGIAVGVHLPRKRHFLIGVDRPRRLPRDEAQLTRMIGDLQLLTVHAQHAAQQIFDAELDEAQERPHLTPREIECLKWTMEGKSAYVIGRILSISTSAVNFHLQNVMRKVDVASKHQAVLKCVALGII